MPLPDSHHAVAVFAANGSKRFPRTNKVQSTALARRPKSQVSLLHGIRPWKQDVSWYEVSKGLQFVPVYQHTDIVYSLAYAEMLLTIARILSRFEMEPLDVVKERDVDVTGDCFNGITRDDSPGIRARILRDNLLT